MHTLIEIAAKHYQGGGSDKVWAVAVISDGSACQLFSCWGRRGSSLQDKVESYSTIPAASAQLRTRAREKDVKGYHDVPWERVDLGIRETLADRFHALGVAAASPAPSVPDTPSAPAVTVASAPPKTIRTVVSHVTSLKPAELEGKLKDPNWGLTEKVNGRRTTVEVRSGNVLAYNRQGVRLPARPAAAAALSGLEVDCLIDGEWLDGENAGSFVMFDLLEWAGASVRDWPYERRIHFLEEQLVERGLLFIGGATLRSSTSLVAGLELLAPVSSEVEKREVLAEVKAQGGEGVIFRELSGPSVEGNTPHELKHKFVAEVDCVVTGLKAGRAAWSITLGLVRPADAQLIEVGTVRSGLTDSDIEALGRLLSAGEHPVLTVAFLPIRTVGITLVEPRTSLDALRDDKPWRECTTEQLIELLGEDRRTLVETAK